MLFFEEVWIIQVYEQGFKILGIHSKFIILQWATISFPLIDQNRVCLKILNVFFCNNVLMTSTNKSKGEDEIDFNVVFLICEFQSSSMHVT